MRYAFASFLDGNRSIYVIDVDRSNLERVTSLDNVKHYPAWSPDGGRFIALSARAVEGAGADIYLAPAPSPN